MTEPRGAYFLADDSVLDLTIAFLNSFRRWNPALPLVCIPFSGRTGQLLSLQQQYGFSMWNDQALLDRCDAISRRFHDETRGEYRKIAAWEGPFEEFIYIDVDT